VEGVMVSLRIVVQSLLLSRTSPHTPMAQLTLEAEAVARIGNAPLLASGALVLWWFVTEATSSCFRVEQSHRAVATRFIASLPQESQLWRRDEHDR